MTLRSGRSTVKFEMTNRRMIAAEMVAEGCYSENAIAKAAGAADRTTIVRWRKQPEFQQAVREFREVFHRQVEEIGIANAFQRIRELDNRWRKLKRIIRARARDAKKNGLEEITPGANTGLFCQPFKNGAYVLDKDLLTELRELEKQAAIETGQWAEKKEVTAVVQLGPIELDGGKDLDDKSASPQDHRGTEDSDAVSQAAGGHLLPGPILDH